MVCQISFLRHKLARIVSLSFKESSVQCCSPANNICQHFLKKHSLSAQHSFLMMSSLRNTKTFGKKSGNCIHNFRICCRSEALATQAGTLSQVKVKGIVLVSSGTKLVFLIVGKMLCFGFMGKTILITHCYCFSCC